MYWKKNTDFLDNYSYFVRALLNDRLYKKTLGNVTPEYNETVY